MNINKRLFFIIIILWAVRMLVPANLDIGFQYGGYYTDNIFLNASSLSDYVSALNLDVNYSQKNLNLYIDMSANLFAENADFNSLKIEPGLEFLKYLKGRNYLYVNAGYSILNYRELFTDFNYRGPLFEAGVKYYLNASLLLKTGYNYQYRDYPNYSSFDFNNHTLFIEFNQFFKTQTTVRLQTGVNYRYYPHVAASDGFGETEETAQGGKGWGNGGHSPTADPVNTIGVPNLFGLIRVAQGIGTRIGLTGEAEMRKNFQGLADAESLINNSYVIYPYNDDYLWDGSRFGFTFSLIPFHEIVVKGRFSYFSKSYPGIFVMNAEGIVIEPNIERADRLTQLHINISKKFKKLDLYFYTIYRDNHSNDDYFTYKMWLISTGIGYYF